MKIRKFGATWCGPCKILNNILENVQKEYPDVEVEHLDIDEVDPAVLRDNKITSVPVMFIIDDQDKVTHRINGVVSRQEIVESLGV